MGHFCATIDKSPETRAVLQTPPSQLEQPADTDQDRDDQREKKDGAADSG
ncbi:MAG: hypothetical protein AB7V06_12815 [Candidatus Obscuribacterales bacterium]